MSRLLNKLSALRVARPSPPGLYGDGGGLWLQVSDTGSKSWLFRYAVRGQRHHMGLGSLRDVSLAEARDLARDLAHRVRAGDDPLAERRAAADARLLTQARQMTFRACAGAYIRAHRPAWRNAKHAQQWENTLETYAFPLLGDLPVGEVDTPLVIKVLEPIWIAKTETGDAPARTHRVDPGLGRSQQIPHGRESGPLAWPP